MPRKVNILVTDSNYIEQLGQYGPIVEPTRMDFRTALHIVNEGTHDVKIKTTSGLILDLDEEKIKKMIRRGDEGIKDIWEEIQIEAEIAKEETEEKVVETKPVKDEQKSSGIKTFTPDTDDDDEIDMDDPTVFSG